MKKINFSMQDVGYPVFERYAEAKANAAVGTQVPRNRYQFADNGFSFDELFRLQCVTDGFKKRDGSRFPDGHR